MVKRQLDATGDRDTLIIAGWGLGLLTITVAGAWASLHLAALATGTPPPTTNPVRLMIDLVRGRTHWTGAATVAAIILGLVGLGLMLGLVILWPKPSAGKRQRSDGSTRYMARPADYAHLTETGARAKARQLGFPGTGLPLGVTLNGNRRLFASWEDTAVLIAGPRTSKTTAYAVPCVLAAPGACIVTSNKRDVVDVTAPIRRQAGTVWLFDPQRVAGDGPHGHHGEPSWFWDPLSYIAPRDDDGRIRRLPDGTVDASETRAERLAAQFVTSARPDGSRTDAYFDGEAENLLSLLLLAAALGEYPITQVYSWLTAGRQDEAVRLLADHRFPLQSEALYALSVLPERQREGVYGTARAYAGFLRNRQLVAWVTDHHGNQGGNPAGQDEQGGRQRFDPWRFARSADTLYSLSREGEIGVSPLVAALTMAVLEELEDYATTQPGGRLEVPCVAVLDEAANVCKLRDLDSKYSHYGSRGIVPLTILQSWHQGADVWGDHGIEKLWSAANCKVYGGGVDDDKFLRRLSELIGSAERIIRSASHGRGGRTVTRMLDEQTILTPAELRELPAGRAVLFASGTPALLIHPVRWFESADADQITASLQPVPAPKAEPEVETEVETEVEAVR